MNRMVHMIFWGTIFLINFDLYAQNSENCFLYDFELKKAKIPPSVSADKPVEPASVIVTITDDTLGKISKYVFGNSIAAWAGAHDNPTLIEGIELLAPTLIRFPGGSWSNGYFWNKQIPSDIPYLIYDGTTYDSNTKTAKKIDFTGHSGEEGWVTSTDQYYSLRRKTNVAQGLITINYGYARYGTSEDPVAQAAHLAADWVRYDRGATKFWEIGNENGGPWEYGWMIDTTMNKDGQPQFISGELYGKHFKVFADSMKKAAREIGATIYIGGQVLQSLPRPGYMWYFVDKDWNQGFFEQVGDAADFYVIHNYFGSSTKVKDILQLAVTEPKRNMDFVQLEILKNNAYLKPLALTEYNIGSGSLERATSYINGMQAVVLICEMIKNNFGLGARWLLVTGESGMFYGGSDEKYHLHPRPDFYYLHYLQKIYGDFAISAASSNDDILCYASRYSSGETGVVIVNTGTLEQVISIDIKTPEDDQNYYIYSFKGGRDNGEFSQNVYINGHGPSPYHWGPFEELSDLPADSYPIEDEIKFLSPARSIQMIMIKGETIYGETNSKMVHLFHNFPNPFYPSTLIGYQLRADAFVTLKVFDVLGREVLTLVNKHQVAGNHSVSFTASDLPNGVYFYRIKAGTHHDTGKLLLLK
ncbi:T9SS type A sorting domain-containing protein [candidate division KSB1 bacterium]|nr:T9SS type A sorting domain-containing protein [candidate division KSB1 bacterium]